MEIVTIHILTRQGPVTVEMPAATTGKYAAKRAAEELGYDPDAEWVLMRVGRVIDPDESVLEWDGKALELGVR